MRRVITYGTFDLLHYGHINLLRRAKALGDYLIVVISSDEFNWNEKHKKCYFTYEQRKALVEAIRYVDLVIPEESWSQKRSDMHEYHIDTFVMGDDWKGKFDFLKEEGVEVVYLPRTPEISSSQIKKDLYRLETWNAYYNAFASLERAGVIELPIIPKECVHNAHMFYIKCKDLETRQAYIKHMRDNDILCVFHYVPLHSAPAGMKYGRFYGEDRYTTAESDRLVRLPMYYNIAPEDLKKVINKTFEFFE